MNGSEGHELTDLLQAWSNGDPQALERLAPKVDHELRRLAHRYMAGERPNHLLQTTALINEAYIRLIGWQDAGWQNKAHFFAVSAQIMRRILVDIARNQARLKRGGDLVETTLDESCAFRPEGSGDLLALDDALTRLAELDAPKSRLVELRFFGGLSVEETAKVLQISKRTVIREWNSAKAWLYRELRRR